LEPAHAPSFAQFQDLILFLATAGVIVPIFKRLKINSTLGFLTAGVMLGPHGLGSLYQSVPWIHVFTVNKPEEITQLAELGVVFLLFMIGLELSWERLRSLKKLVFGLGTAQAVLCAVALAGGAMLLGFGATEAIILGIALGLSSTAVVLPALAERGKMNTGAGRAVFGILLFQDLAVAPLLIALGIWGAGKGFGFSALLAFLPALAGIAILSVVGRLALRPLMRSVAKSKSDDLFLAACLLIVIGAGLASAAAGLSMALGAFIAGLLLAETEYRHEIEHKVEPFKGLLLGLFFVSVGVSLDVQFTISHLPQVLTMAVGLVVIKTAITWGAGRVFGLPSRKSLEVALAIAAGGEFAFVILGQASGSKLIPTEGLQTALAAVTLSMFCVPLLVALGSRINKPIGAAAPEGLPGPSAAPAGEGAPSVLLVGYGRVGRLVAEMLTAHNLPWVALERDPRAAGVVSAGGKVFYGDASDEQMLKRCGLETATALVVTMDAPDLAEIVVGLARELRADLPIVARARDARHAGQLYALGVTDAVPETIEASLQLSEAVLVDVGVPMGLVIASIHEKRDEIRRELNRPDALGGRRKTLRRDHEALDAPAA
jgi:CPA2 family monovalent cation:H+ antiporter-2